MTIKASFDSQNDFIRRNNDANHRFYTSSFENLHPFFVSIMVSITACQKVTPIHTDRGRSGFDSQTKSSSFFFDFFFFLFILRIVPFSLLLVFSLLGIVSRC